MFETSYGVSASMQNRLIIHRDSRSQSNDVVSDNLRTTGQCGNK